mmetsp:Transcript_17396/g.29840  ORF Transcript_17396/g.29840 Transcript_17396/m.29840 type:complete len:280 (-) Transcript_17396:160-999(-)|eukprot:CAMPEP_0119108364 /NCGR_PEP_ID=MMETSP1180-20130426/13961_1 /TAXON_ID=3052 ORGANISM="Chlamydomonas cf sp, Strain CCMP681" /NCGR_SAMPLE_ID=MMETSP1180 /ASSEMBLY_ACC=CAM_ASM_000741 /LENGTH=279 /DNA_ID=CAMNT_0007093967 /DNA_START=131 /DNA_END=970 /DNA_ORIENTATION=+
MLRQGSGFAMRLLHQQQTAGTSLMASMSGNRLTAVSEIGAEVAMTGAMQAPVAQFSSASAAALANKRAGLIGMGDLKASGRAFASFASNGALQSAAVVPIAAAAHQADKAPSMLARLAKAAAVVAGALLVTAGTASADAPQEWQYLFQDMATSTGQAMVDLHHDIMFLVISISVLVIYLLFQISTKFHYSRQLKPEKLTHHTMLEVIWTIIPTIIVLTIAVPSLTLIYSLDQHTERPGLTVKVIGRQWYWSYEMHDHLQQKLLDPERLLAIAEKSVMKA